MLHPILCCCFFILIFHFFKIIFLSQTANVVQMLLYELSRNPDVQQTLHDEVTGVVPQGELPSAAHLQNLPYLKAVVKETLRCASRIFRLPIEYNSKHKGARCSSVVRAFAHGVMGRRINPSRGGPIELFLIPASAPRLV